MDLPIGLLVWRTDDGEVQDIQSTAFAFRRRGVATALWRAAHAYLLCTGLAAPQPPLHQTSDGAAWAQAVDAEQNHPRYCITL